MDAPAITRLPAIVDALAPADRELFSRLYSCYLVTGRLILPDQIRSRARLRFGEVESQQIVRVTNLRTCESALFNSLRAIRPFQTPRSSHVKETVARAGEGPFARPLEETPCDTFGRIEGAHTITASNVAKYDYLHALIIFKDPDPFVTDEAVIADMLDVAMRWYQEAHRACPAAIYPFFLWNCLWRAGASILHGHAQTLITHVPYSTQIWMDTVQKRYRQRYDADYLEDLVAVHEMLGLGMRCGKARVMAYLTPKKEREVFLIAPKPADLAPAISETLLCYRRMGVESFNAAIFMPPIGQDGTCYARIVDRGDLSSVTSDIGGMELYAGTAVIAADPFRLIEQLGGG
ncbi:MAG: hypothetical protein KO206_01570 [Methanomicrobiaceae archaeon]|uniref:Uncharacterized protein n=1 Tax=hydrocarbon metagenome TaxID=938273 RepID=A0A0W8FH51_9ZZZZ|nr:hypothetical protein [Methanomicrobiaceae archaeon]MDD5418910.1 hypothetical protein [Methanomicrobiaceae archaeon]